MAWTVTKEARAVSFSNWLAHGPGESPDEDPVPTFYKPQGPVRLKRVPDLEPDPFAQQPTVEDAGRSASLFLGQSMAIYEDLLDRLPMMILVIDGDGIVQNANRMTSEVLGYAPEALCGRRMLSLLTERSREWLLRHVMPDYEKSGQFKNIDVQFTTRAGRTADFLMSAIGYRNPEGRLERSIAVFADMSERTAAVAALGRSQQRFRSAFEAAAHGMAVLNPDGRFDTVNEALAEILGLDMDELKHVNFHDLLAVDDLARAKALFERLAVPGNTGLQSELRYRAPGNRLLVGLTSLSAVKDAAGRPEQFIVQIVDVTERQKAESHLRQAQKMEAVGHLTGGIAHDFNNLLTVIMGNLQLVEGALQGDAKAEKRAHEAYLAASKGSQLTKQLLAFARRQPLVPQELKVNRLISGMEDLLKRSIGEALDLRIDLMPGDPCIIADATQLETSIINLAINARDAMPEGGRLTVETAPVEFDGRFSRGHEDVLPGHYVMIAVSDTGVGIPKHLLHKVFQPFFTTKEVGKGSGLGLSMVFGFIKQSGGHIRIYSEEGRGTTIKMYLPRKLAEGEALVPEAEQEMPRRAKILLVEDQEEVRSVAREFLLEFGYEVVEVGSAIEALQTLQSHDDFDLLFTDVIMPGGMNGFDLSQAAAQIRPSLKVIHASGYPRGAVVHQEEPRLRDNLISKPFQRDELRRVVEDTLTGRGAFARTI
ncbi:MAG: PAS domain S-box protein [Parvibaculaceae bacterium]